MTKEKRDAILIVDDEPLSIEFLANALSPEYEIIIAINGKEAIERAENENDRLAIILLDVKLPDIDGYQVCMQLKANLKTQNIPVIFVTRVNIPKLEVQGLAIGAVDYISKKCDLDVIMERIKKRIEQKH